MLSIKNAKFTIKAMWQLQKISFRNYKRKKLCIGAIKPNWRTKNENSEIWKKSRWKNRFKNRTQKITRNLSWGAKKRSALTKKTETSTKNYGTNSIECSNKNRTQKWKKIGIQLER